MRVLSVRIISFLLAATIGSAAFSLVAAADPVVSVEDTASGTSASGDGAVGMSFSYGFADTAKSGRLIPFNVEIFNNSEEELHGTLVIETDGVVDDGAGSTEKALLRYTYPAELVPGGTIDILSTISMPSEDGEARLSLYDGAGVPVAEGSARINLAGGSQNILIGILSDRPETLEYFKNLSIAGSGLRTKTVELSPESLPVSASGYEQLDILIVSDFDTSLISSASLRAIEQWVAGGGVMIIGTGSHTEDAGIFARGVDELTVTPLGERSVNMGIKYSKTDDPDGAVLSLSLSDVFAGDGLEVMQSDDIAMLTRVGYSRGIIAIAAYDFTEIQEFCTEEAGYAEDILSESLGADRLGELNVYMDSSREYYDEVRSIAGISDTPSAARVTVYMIAAAAFITLIVACYIYLRARGLSLYYYIFVLIAAFLAAVAVWLMGIRSRNVGIDINYAYIRQIREDMSEESGFVRMRLGTRGTGSVSFDEGYEVYPIVFGGEEGLFEREETGHLITVGADGTLELSSKRPFAGLYAEFSRIEEDEESAVVSDIDYFDGRLTAVITNNYDYRLKDAVLLIYGEMFPLGDIEPGGTVSLDNAETLTWPRGNASEAASMISGIEEYGADSAGYAMKLRETGLLTHYLDNIIGAGDSGTVLIAFADEAAAAPGITSGERLFMRGEMMLAESLDADYTEGIYTWRDCLNTEPRVVSGDYDIVTNTAYASCVLEYTLGSGMSISGLSFRSLPEGYETRELIPFEGKISLYNYESGSYDYIGSREADIDAGLIGQYLSPGNTLTVRYTPSDAASGARMYLPVPSVVGIEGDRNA